MTVTPVPGDLSEEVMDACKAALKQAGEADYDSARFEPLPVDSVFAELFLPADTGHADNSSSNSVHIDLSAAGVQEWLYNIKNGNAVRGCLRLSYCYPAAQPMAPARVIVSPHLPDMLRSRMNSDEGGMLYITRDEAERAWSDWVGEGNVRVENIAMEGGEREADPLAREILLEQARICWFSSTFVPAYNLADGGHKDTPMIEPLFSIRGTNAPGFPYPLVKAREDGIVWLMRVSEISLMDLFSCLDSTYMLSTSLSDY